MKWNKCSFDFGGLNPNYCPNCGKRISINVARKSIQNIDLFRLCTADKDRFEAFFKKMPSLNCEDIRNWLLDYVENPSVYCIVAEYDYVNRNFNGEYVSKEHRTLKRASIQDVQDRFLDSKSYSNIKLYSQETLVTKTFGAGKYRENWWWDKQECESVIHELISRHGKE